MLLLFASVVHTRHIHFQSVRRCSIWDQNWVRTVCTYEFIRWFHMLPDIKDVLQ